MGDCDTLARMSSVRVKICGITNLQDALAATEAGAHYLGFIFWPHSKRAVDVPTVQTIIAALRARVVLPTLVGVFVDESVETVAATLDTCNLDLAQLSGSEPPSYVGDRHSPLYGRSFKVLHPTSLAEAEADAEWYLPPEPVSVRPSLLLDAFHPQLPGGSGQRADWSIAAQLAAHIPGIMLAGGLTPENVASAIRQVRPFAVDVASGVEAQPGKKDHERVRKFIAAALGA